jgi:dipeptidyl aminopeptidase/acylaminoacyl peptidase
MSDPLTTLLLADEVPVDPPVAFADALLDRCLHELRPGRRRGLVVALAFVATLIVAGAATATYLATRESAAPAPPSATGLTIIRTLPQSNAVSTIAAVVDGRLRTVWRCPHHIWCGVLSSMAWSPDGRHLAMTLGEIGGRSGYVGLHVIDVATGADHHLGAPRLPHLEREQPISVIKRLVDAVTARLGCPLPAQVAWSPDSRQLAYSCGDDLLHGGAPTTIYMIRRDGGDRRRLATGTSTAYWPTWSADGKRIAFSTEPYPRLTYHCCSDDPLQHLRGRVYSIGVDGSHRVLVARDAAAPAYSPDGKRIAFETTCGVRSAAVGAATFLAPTCAHADSVGPPSWAPDGSTLAVAATQGVLLVTPDGTSVGVAVAEDARGAYEVGAPAWAPTEALAHLLSPRGASGY